MRIILLFLCLSGIFASPAHALTTSERALRIEDKRDGNVLLGAESATIERGEIFKTVVLLWGKLDVYGEIDEVVVLSGHVVFHESAKVNKSVVVMGGTFESQPGAKVAAEDVVMKVPGPAWRMLQSLGNVWRENFDWVARLFAGLVFVLISWLSGWATFYAFPRLQSLLADGLVANWGKNLILGFFGSIAACALSVMLVVSIIGILLVPFYLLTLAIAGSTAYLAAALWAGHRLLPPKAGKRINPWGFLLGLLALQFLWEVPVWWASLPVLVLWTLAWGAMVRSLGLLWR